ncbi:protein-disulfide reductase DsbD [Arenicella xantha]|uniref:Thiol:disulfide interchange protein DsbD n=1 Tax=Arenicella xantha TaxID=644221 RepID=A0A395JPS1_9GAMM|nr:protein-disulfide reductase DsbD [Arenicella xantha]RBP53641.1 thiol:disulfide interchange protein DsbD [Arenicella xantha]
MKQFSYIALRLAAFSLLVMMTSANAQFWSKKESPLLPEEQAFSVTAEITDQQLKLFWTIAPDYYMYRDQFQVSSATPGVEIGDLQFPAGETEDDPLFGQVVVYFYNVELIAPLTALPDTATSIELTLLGQGCNKPVGVCYPPQTRVVTVDYTPSANAPNTVTATDSSPENLKQASDKLESNAPQKSFWSYVAAAFVAGLVLSFTPCVLPMIPILLGVIAGQQNPSRLRAGWLAFCYVMGTVAVYAVAGWLAGLSGTQLQAYFQNPWVIGFICGLLLLLAASLFGAFRLELPSSVQTKLSGQSISTRSVSITTFFLGVISSLVVGACVSPVLFITIGAAIKAGDPVLGSAIMSALALGMGLLLILVGFGAGWILPRAGAWMKQVQILFGFMVIGVAIYIAGFIAAVPVLALWCALLLWTGFYLWQLGENSSVALSAAVLRGLGLAALLWGAMALVGVATGGNNIFQPLATVNVGGSNSALKSKLPFNSVTTLNAAKTLLDKAKTDNKPVLVDFYADWCLDCKRMASSTFLEPEIHEALSEWALIEVDVTVTNDNSEALKRFFDVFGPPATLFIQANGQELSDLRQYGYLNKSELLALVARANN